MLGKAVVISGKINIVRPQSGVLDSCMHLAAMMGHTDIVQLFLDKGVEVNCKWTNQLHSSPWDSR